MKNYEVNKLLIGGVGNTYYNSNGNIELSAKEFGIVIQKNDYEYLDIFSDRKYVEFNSYMCNAGIAAIINVKSLNTFIRALIASFPELEDLEIIQTLLKQKFVSEEVLNNLLNALEMSIKYKKNLYDMLAMRSNDNDKINLKADFVNTITNKKYKIEPAICKDSEIDSIITTLAESKKSPILIGKSGVGKTIIVDELAYKIQRNNVPDFFKKKKIIELDLPTLFIDSKTIENKFIRFIKNTNKSNTIIFVDDIDKLINKNNNFIEIIINEIKKNNLKLISTIHEENYNNYFNNDVFNKININEPDEKSLYQIILKTFNYYSKLNRIKLIDNMDELISILINLTKLENRILENENYINKTFNYDIYNPGLVINIIDKIFADAKVHNNKKITVENIIYGIDSCNKIKQTIKTENNKKLLLKKGN